MFCQKVLLSISNTPSPPAGLKGASEKFAACSFAQNGSCSLNSQSIRIVTKFQGEKCSWKLFVYHCCSIIRLSSVHSCSLFSICVLYSFIRLDLKALFRIKYFFFNNKNEYGYKLEKVDKRKLQSECPIKAASLHEQHIGATLSHLIRKHEFWWEKVGD